MCKEFLILWKQKPPVRSPANPADIFAAVSTKQLMLLGRALQVVTK